ncbi:MAG: leucine-rich repeat protein [Treponema sp.]
MKTTIFNKKALAFFGAAAILLAAVFTTGCKTDAGSGDPAPEMFAVAFSVDGANGTLKAKADGIAETDKSPIVVQKGKTVTFTATPKNGYKVDKWTITVGTFESGTGTEGNTTAKVKITADTKVNVSFKSETITPPSPTEFTVQMEAGEHGTLSESPVIPAGGKVAKDKVITFTATPADGYGVDKWTITGGTVEAGTGTDGSLTAKVKISADTKVNVSFKAIVYTSVSFTNLNAYLKNTASSTDINYIKVTGLTAADLEVEHYFYSYKPSALGKILNDNPTKKVALKLSEVSGLTNMSNCFFNCTSLTQVPVIPSGVTDMSSCFKNCKSLTQAPEIPSSVTDMSSCFYGCESLTQAPEIPSSVTYMGWCFYYCKSLTQAPAIPSGVTNMSRCFSGCKSLTQAPVIPSGVTDMSWCFSGCEKITAVTLKCDYVEGNFNRAFFGCEKLSANSIKVPAGQLQTYKDNAGMMGTTADKFVAE